MRARELRLGEYGEKVGQEDPGTCRGGAQSVANLPALLTGWGLTQTWVLQSGSQFRPDEGPSLTSDAYARDLNELKELGSLTSATRTAEQTDIARFWLTSAAVIWDAALRQVAIARHLDTASTAHALALVNLAGADAAIACWDAKYAFSSWRPITAIRNADEDGNPETTADPTWSPLVPTPNFPEFVSGHTTVSGAMGTMLALLFGDDPGVTLAVTSPTNPGFVHTWARFSEAIAEVIDARVWTGFHFRSSDVAGASALVFFENLRAYGRVNGVMTEDRAYNPCSRKGEVRAHRGDVHGRSEAPRTHGRVQSL